MVGSFEVAAAAKRVSFTHRLGRADRPRYFRIRGTDGNRAQPGYHGAGVAPSGPAIDILGNADPWADLWFYANPIFVLP